MSTPDGVLSWVFSISLIVFFGGMVLMIPTMAVSLIAPVWGQYIFLAVAIPTIAALPILFVAASLLLVAAPLLVFLQKRGQNDR